MDTYPAGRIPDPRYIVSVRSAPAEIPDTGAHAGHQSRPDISSESPHLSKIPTHESRPCSATTTAGEPCKAWAVHDTGPPLCSAHAGRNVGAGAPLGNQNRTTRGFYASVLSRRELADILEGVDLTPLQSEIACACAALRRLLKHLTETGGIDN
jgi:hypothetical protein